MSYTHTVLRRLVAVAGCSAALVCGPVFAADAPASNAKDATVVFVCAHGSIKSLMATERFNRLAEHRGLSIRAISRASNAEMVHDKIPEMVVKEMAREGFAVGDVRPEVLSREEATSAIRLVQISKEGPITQETDPTPAAAVDLKVERWNDIPSAFKAYETTRSMIAERVDALIEEYAKKHAGLAAK
jgi:protein-tyrosine-phosphatase